MCCTVFRMQIKNLSIWPPLFLAPMAGLTHSALRTLLLHCGGVGLLSTEMLSAASLPRENEHFSPYLVRTAEERPLSYQLLVADERQIVPAMARVCELGADSVDLNLGCPAPQVRRMGGGSCLVNDPERIRRLVRQGRRATDKPLTAKIRLGEQFDETKLRELCLLLAGEGIDLLTVHARLRKESFSRPPHWSWVGKVKQWIDIPVVANGGIDSVEAARLCLNQSGADGLMIGRAAAVSPWLFNDIAREVYGVELPEPERKLPQLYAEFVQALVERFPSGRCLGRMKEFTHYFAENYFFGHHLASRVQSSQSVEEAWRRAMAFFMENDADQKVPDLLPLITGAQGDCSTRRQVTGTAF